MSASRADIGCDVRHNGLCVAAQCNRNLQNINQHFDFIYAAQKKIQKSFLERVFGMTEKPLHELALAYIPTAANFIDEDKMLFSTLVGISMDFDCSSDDN